MQERKEKSVDFNLSLDLKYRTVEWNRARGTLEVFDPMLELRMLTEEANEFYHAETYPHMLQELADFIFVADGTDAKYRAQKDQSITMFMTGAEAYETLSSWVSKTAYEMYLVLKGKAVACGVFSGDVIADLEYARSCVVTANESKPNKKVEGKVVKGDRIDPLPLIEEYIYKYYPSLKPEASDERAN